MKRFTGIAGRLTAGVILFGLLLGGGMQYGRLYRVYRSAGTAV